MSADRPLYQRTALVTGAAAGIGQATASALARDGADVALNDLPRAKDSLAEAADALAERHGVRTAVVPAAVGDEAETKEMVETAADELGGLSVLVNNAGVARDETGGVERLSTADYRTIMETNVDGVFFATRAALPYLRAASGNLIFVGSFSGKYPRPFNPVYAGSKWWIQGFAQSVAAKDGADGIAVTVVNPSETRTTIDDHHSPSDTFTYEPGQASEPEEIAEAIAFAARQRPPTTASEINMYRRDKFSHF